MSVWQVFLIAASVFLSLLVLLLAAEVERLREELESERKRRGA
jgi:hypothetical protein